MGRKVRNIRGMTTPKPVADQLRDAIKASGMSLNELAKKADSNAMSMSRFMRGGSLKIETAESIARALGMKSLKIAP